MAYINVDPSFPNHRKTIRLKAALGNDADIFPIRAWCWCALHSPETGSFGDMTEAEIAYILGYHADPKILIDTLLRAGFILKRNSEYFCSNWLEHNGHIAAFSKRAKKNAVKRWRIYSLESHASSNASSIARKKSSIASSNAPTYLPNQPTKPNLPIVGAGQSREKDSFHLFMDRALPDFCGIDPTQPAAVSAGYRRYGKAGRDILAFANGDPEKAYEGTKAIGRWMESRSLTWGLDTAAKWFPDWMNGGLDGKNSSKDSARTG